MRTGWRKHAAIGFLGGALGLVLGALWLGGLLVRLEQQRRLWQGAQQIAAAIERYGRDTAGSYPQDSSDLLRQGYLAQWPPSPYGGRMQPLTASAAAQPGGFVYLPSGPLIAAGPGSTAQPPLLPQQVDSYALLVYGPGRYPAQVRAAHAAWREHAAQQDAQPPVEEYTVYDLAPQIDWARVVLVLSAGGDGAGSA
jgi:hypothetical protein